MKKLFFLLPAMVLLAAACSQPSATSNQASNNSPSQGQKFADQPYYHSAYLISGASLSVQARQALNGFTMGKQTLASGDTQITLKAIEAGYHDQQYTLKPGQDLYFIEKFSGDDATAKQKDNNLGDDTAVVVDSQGNVVSGPNSWSK